MKIALFECLKVWAKQVFRELQTVQFPLCWPHFMEVKIHSYIILYGLSFYRLNCAFDGMIDFSVTNALCSLYSVLAPNYNLLKLLEVQVYKKHFPGGLVFTLQIDLIHSKWTHKMKGRSQWGKLISCRVVNKNRWRILTKGDHIWNSRIFGANSAISLGQDVCNVRSLAYL